MEDTLKQMLLSDNLDDKRLALEMARNINTDPVEIADLFYKNYWGTGYAPNNTVVVKLFNEYLNWKWINVAKYQWKYTSWKTE